MDRLSFGCRGLHLLLTLFFSPTILFGERHIRWTGEEGDRRCLRISPFVPAEFWVDVHFDREEDGEAVAALVEDCWRPSPIRPGGIFGLGRDEWRVTGLLIVLCMFLASPLGFARYWGL